MISTEHMARSGERLVQQISDLSRGKTAVGITILFLITVILINGRPFGIMTLLDITGGASIPDMELWYSGESLYGILGALGEAGRFFYLTSVLPLDLVFPTCYGVFLAIILSHLVRIAGLQGTIWQYVVLLPIVAAIFDYAENILMIIILIHYPDTMPMIASCVSLCTVIKGIGVRGSFLLIGGGIVYSVITFIRYHLTIQRDS